MTPPAPALALFPNRVDVHNQPVKMLNDEGDVVDLYIPRKW